MYAFTPRIRFAAIALRALGISALLCASVRVALATPNGRLEELARGIEAKIVATVPKGQGVRVEIDGITGVDRTLCELVRARLSEAAERPRSTQWAAKLRTETNAGKLRAIGEIVEETKNLWETRREVRALVFIEVEIDDELRARIGGGGAQVASGGRTRRIALPNEEISAIAIGDVDGSGTASLLAISDGTAIRFTWRGDGLREASRVGIIDEAALSRPRRTVAQVAIVDKGRSLVRSSFAARTLVIDRKMAVFAEAESFPLAGGRVRCPIEPGVDWFARARCDRERERLPERFIAVASGAGSAEREILATVDDANVLTVFSAKSGPAQIAEGVGTQVIVLERDGRSWIVASEATRLGAPDGIDFRALDRGLAVERRIETPAPVKAFAIGDLDGDGRVEVAAIVRDARAGWTELWLID